MVPLPSPRPVPHELHEEYESVLRLRSGGDFEGAARRCSSLLQQLSGIWGRSHPDLAPYYYNFALTLKQAGRHDDCLTVLANALAKWPDDLQCRVLDATTRAEVALSSESFSDLAHRGFETILVPELVPRLRGMRVAPVQLYGQWAEMLLRAHRFEEALDRARRGLEDDPGHRGCRATQGRALVRLQRDAEAVTVLESVVDERPAPELSLYLALAYSRSGAPRSAWSRFEALLSADLDSWAGSQGVRLRRLLLQEAGRTLNDLGRHRESAELSLDLLRETPDRATGLFQLSRSLRALGSDGAADALDLRIRRLAPREHHIKSAELAGAAGLPASVFYYQALAASTVDRSGEALRLLEAALRRAPQAVGLHLERSRIRALLGRVDRAEWEIRRAATELDSPLLQAERARLLARLGDVDEARKVLAELDLLRAEPAKEARRSDGPHELGPDHDVSSRKGLAARCATAHLQLADPESARKWLVTAPVDEESLLCRAGIAVAEGRLDEARRILRSSFHELPGGATRAGALRLLVDLQGAKEDGSAGPGAAQFDPSDAIDNPHLFRHGLFLGRSTAPGEGTDTLSVRIRSIGAILDRRDGIARSMRGSADRDVVARFEAMHALYVEVRAHRKAREVASYLVRLEPSKVAASLRLARTFSAPEHIVVRVSAIRNALRLSPAHPEALRLLEQEQRLLGLEVSRQDR